MGLQVSGPTGKVGVTRESMAMGLEVSAPTGNGGWGNMTVSGHGTRGGWTHGWRAGEAGAGLIWTCFFFCGWWRASGHVTRGEWTHGERGTTRVSGHADGTRGECVHEEGVGVIPFEILTRRLALTWTCIFAEWLSVWPWDSK